MILAQFLLYISILGSFPRRKSGSYGLKNRLKEALYSKAGIAEVFSGIAEIST